MNVLDQSIGNGYALYHGDCVEVLKGLPDNSIDFSVFSPPFASLYTYSPSARDFGNSTYEEFWQQYAFLAAEQLRVHKPGRLLAAHCMQLTTTKGRDGFISMVDFRGHLIKAYQDAGWHYHSEICIWKNPVNAMQRTKANRLLYMQLKKDSAKSGQGFADYVIVMGKPGDNMEPVTKDPESFPVEMWQRYASPVWAFVDGTDSEGFAICTDRQISDDETSGIDPGDTLQYRSAREHDDERHICPLQLPVAARCIRLWSNPGDTVLSPFSGIGSEGYIALQEGRRFIGAELKLSYYQQAARNLRAAESPAQTKMEL